MFKLLIAPLCGLAVAGTLYSFNSGHCSTTSEDAGCGSCTAPSSVLLLSAAAATAPASAPAAIDVKNTKCIVMSDDDASAKTVTYNGKTYHVCCKDCIEEFNKNPEKFVKAFDANPAKYGVKK